MPSNKKYTVLNDVNVKKVRNGVESDSYDGDLGYSLIRITVNKGKWYGYRNVPEANKILNITIIGLMTNSFNYGLSSDWSTMDYPLNIDAGLIGDAVAFGGGGSMGEVYKSKKVWKKSGSVTLSPEIRIYDANGTGLPIQAVKNLLRLSTSYGSSNVVEKLTAKFEDIKNNTLSKTEEIAEENNATLKETDEEKKTKKINSFLYGTLNDTSGTLKNGIELFKAGMEDIGSLPRKAGTTIREGFRAVSEDFSDQLTLRYSPPVVKVEIGKIFKHDDMVITKVDFKFSDEKSKAGPLYVDVSLTIESRKIISGYGDTGFVLDGEGVTVINIESAEGEELPAPVEKEKIDAGRAIEQLQPVTEEVTDNTFVSIDFEPEEPDVLPVNVPTTKKG